MSFRKKTIKFGEKFGTPTTPTETTPKAPSPKAPKIVRTVTAPTVTTGAPRTKPTATRGVLTQQEAGQIAQETFRTRVQTLTAPIRALIEKLTIHAKYQEEGGKGRNPQQSMAAAAVVAYKQIAVEEEKIKKIELEQHNIVLQNNVNQILQALESGNIITPDYFQNNIAWVKSGAITQQAFLDAYYYLSNQGIIHTAPIIEPEIIIEKPLEFLCSDIYRLENGNVIKTTYDTLTVTQLQAFINEGLLIRECNTPAPTQQEVRQHYNYIEPETRINYNRYDHPTSK